MIWFLLTRYTAYLWNMPAITEDATIAMCVISTIETIVEIGILIAWLCERHERKNKGKNNE